MRRAIREIYIWSFFLLLIVAVVNSTDQIHSAFDLLIFLVAIAVKAGLIAALLAPFTYAILRFRGKAYRSQR